MVLNLGKIRPLLWVDKHYKGFLMQKKTYFLAMLVVLLAFGFAFIGCSTVPASKFVPNKLEIDEILGPIPGHFLSYEAAFEEAKKLYSRAQAVIYLKSIGGNNTIPWSVAHGYYAVTIKVVPLSKSFP
jgi:hypothetical protein